MEIERNAAPISGRTKTMYPWPDLEPGDALVIEGKQSFVRAVRASWQWGRRHGARFASAWDSDTATGRVQRVS